MNVDKNMRDKFKDDPYFGACEEFCERWDETAFDPNFESLPLTEFEPMLLRILERTPYSISGHLNEPINVAKASLNCYDFNHWLTKNA
jgi:predicted HD phosphohydrolase